MNEAIESFGSLSTLIPLGIVFVLGISAIVGLFVVASRVRRGILANDKDFAAAMTKARQSGSKSPANARLLLRVANCIDQELKEQGVLSQRWLVHADVVAAYESGCEDALQGRSIVTRLLVGIGNSLTGISLIFTFGLIAWVLASDVPAAIRGVASNDLTTVNLGNESLRKAVGLVGVKFLISAVGLFWALIFRATEAHRSTSLREQAAHSIHGHLALFPSRESHHMEILCRHLGQLEAGLANAVQTVATAGRDAVSATERQTSELGSRLDQLASIEVSVKDMGNEVKAHLGAIMKQHVADQICTALAELRDYADQAVTRMQEGLSQSFAQVTTNEMQQVRTALETIRDAVASQGQGQLATLIESMRDMMSGGFRSESQGMVEAMSGLRDAIPRLEAQLRRMAEDVDRDFRERSDATQKIQSELLAQMQTTLASNRDAQVASQEALAGLLDNAQKSTVELQARIAGSGEEMVGRLVNTAMSNFGDLRSQFEKLNELAAGNVGDFSREVGAARDALAGTREGLEGILGTVRAMANQLRVGLDGNAAAAAFTRQAMETYERATQVVQLTAERLTTTVARLDEQLRKEETILVQQREFAEKILPNLIGKYVEALDQQSSKLRTAWSELAEKVERTVAGAGEALATGVEDLGDHVNALKGTLEKAMISKG
jgi:hypothetical protein